VPEVLFRLTLFTNIVCPSKWILISHRVLLFHFVIRHLQQDHGVPLEVHSTTEGHVMDSPVMTVSQECSRRIANCKIILWNVLDDMMGCILE